MTNFGLPQKTISIIHEILKKYPSVKQAIIYGSRAKGNYRPGSDIDLTLKGDIDYQTISRISSDLEESWIAYEVDVSAYNSLNDEYLLKEINTHGLVFFEAV